MAGKENEKVMRGEVSALTTATWADSELDVEAGNVFYTGTVPVDCRLKDGDVVDILGTEPDMGSMGAFGRRKAKLVGVYAMACLNCPANGKIACAVPCQLYKADLGRRKKNK